LEAGRHLTVVEDIDALAPALVEAVRSPEVVREQAAAGRRRVLERYDWDVLAEQLEQVWLRQAA
jgi:glycosyltransferase involved in cell wall biosynthesis